MIRAARLLIAAVFGLFAPLGAAAQVIPFFGQPPLPMVPFPQTVSVALSCSQATTYLARTSGGNEGGNATNITNLICGLVADGVITGDLVTTGCGSTAASFDALYIEAQQNSADALLNLCGTNYTATVVGSPPFTTYRGYSFNGTNWLLDTMFNATTATSPHYTQNLASIGIWSDAVVTEATPQLTDGGGSWIYDSYTGNLFYGRINDGSSGASTSPGTEGLFVADRSSSANVIPYWDGIAQPTQTGASVTPTNHDLYIGNTVSGLSGTAQTLSEAHMGGSLGAILNLALYNRLRTYMTAVGVP